MNKIYDCFPFFNELDILEIRLELLYDVVDFFVISECDYTFSGLKKPFFFEENKHRYEKYLDKIIHIKHTDTFNYTNLVNNYIGNERELYDKIINRLEQMRISPETGYGLPHWCRDYLHKELAMMGIVNCDENDIILFGDCDEIPSPSALLEVVKNPRIDDMLFTLNQKNMIYYINNENVTEKWFGQFITKYKNIKESSCMFTRNLRTGFELVDNGGWHLTFMGGKDKIVEKIKSWGHQEYNNPQIINSIDFMLNSGMDVLHRSISFVKHDIENLYPKKIVDLVRQKYHHLIA